MFKSLIIHFRNWAKFLILIIIGLIIITSIVFSVYKPMYTVSINGKFIGYTEDKSLLQDKINEYMKSGDKENVAFVDIEVLPEYSFCLLKKDHESNDDEIFSKVIETGVTYYKYYAVLVNNEEKCYVSSYEECEQIIQGLKDKDSQNKDKVSYIVKYEQEKKEFTNTETAIANLYVEKPKVLSSGSVKTSANISFAKVDLGISLIRPVNATILTSRFGDVSSVRSGAHTGLDIAASTGTPIVAAASGTVTYSGWKKAYGWMIVIDHGNGVQTYYAHCNKLHRSAGEYVEQGEHIADVGNTGNSTGSHLHLEVRVNGIAYNPKNYVY